MSTRLTRSNHKIKVFIADDSLIISAAFSAMKTTVRGAGRGDDELVRALERVWETKKDLGSGFVTPLSREETLFYIMVS